MNNFSNNDVLGQANPSTGNGASETLREAVLKAPSAIDRELPNDPAVAARLHDTVVTALSAVSDYKDAGQEFDAAGAHWTQADGELSEQAITAQLEHVAMGARSYEPHSLDTSRALFANEEKLFNQLHKPSAALDVALSC